LTNQAKWTAFRDLSILAWAFAPTRGNDVFVELSAMMYATPNATTKIGARYST
jgi:hypothetical protein